MTDRTNDDNLYDEKYLVRKIAEEEELLVKSQSTLADHQKRKKELTSSIRSLTHKIKNFEEELIHNGLTLEKLKVQRDKYVSKVDKNAVNKLIIARSEGTVKSLIEKINPGDMLIQVEFEGQTTSFRVRDHQVRSPKNTRTGSQTENDSFSRGSRTASMMEGEKKSMKKERNEFVCKTFQELKQEVAAFFSLAPGSFFFADTNNAIFLDDLPIRTSLFPADMKITRKVACIKIILPNNYKYDEMIAVKYREKVGEKIVEDDWQQKAELREAYDNEQARKLADQRKKNAIEYQAYKEKMFKFKSFCSALLYLVLILMWLITRIADFDYSSTVTMTDSTKNTFENTWTTNTAMFYNILKNDISSSADYTRPEWGFFQLTYLMPNPEIVVTRYKPATCPYTNNFMKKYYPSLGISCTNLSVQTDTDPFQANGVTYYYSDDPKLKVRIPTRRGSFNNFGYHLPVDLNDPNMPTKIANFVNASLSEFVSFNAVFYSPSLQKLACTYRIVYRYNQDKTNTDRYIYVFNVRPKTSSSLLVQDLILFIASLLMISTMLDIIHFVPASKVELDLDLVWRRKNTGKKGATTVNLEEEAERYQPKCKMIPLGSAFIKIFWPSSVNLLNLAGVTMNMIVVGLDIAQQNALSEINLTTGENINCPSMVERWTVNQILTAIFILLLMVILLRFIAQFVPFLQIFIVMVQNIVKNTYSLGILILWFFISLSFYGAYTYGSFIPLLDNLVYFYTSVVLVLMKKNIVPSQGDDWWAMYINIGSSPMILFMLLAYISITFIVIKTITAIVIKSIKDAEGAQKKEHMDEELLKEKSLRFLRSQFYEECRATQSKARTKLQEEAMRQHLEAEAKPKKNKKTIPL